MSTHRLGTASRLKTAQGQSATSTGAGIGTATRLTTALRPGTRGGVGGGAAAGAQTTLNTTLRVEDRPITQQGLGGLKTAVRGPRRQIEDKSYFLGLLRSKINEISVEINNLNSQYVELEEENASFIQYEQMAERLAMEIRDLQGELGDYNTIVDKATLGGDVTSVEMEWADVKANNEVAERNLEAQFEERQLREKQLKVVEQELKQEQQMTENLLKEMPDDQHQEYLRLRDLNSHLIGQLNEGQIQLEKLTNRQTTLEDELLNSQVKQEAMRLYKQLHEAEDRKDQLEAELASQEDPQLERERLLKQVREDNQEMARIERQTHETEEKASRLEEELRQSEQELDESRNERNQKYRELKKREAQIDEFLKTFDSAKSSEQTNITDLERQIVELLELTSRHIVNTARTVSTAAAISGATTESGDQAAGLVGTLRDQVNFKAVEVAKSEETAANLVKERARLSQDLLKVDQLEVKVSQEMETLKKKVSKMSEEIEVFSDLEKVKEAARSKQEAITCERDRLEVYRENLHRTNQRLAKEYANAQSNLNTHDTHIQLTNLERKWAQHEQVNHGLAESIADQRMETDHTPIAKRALEMVLEYNDCLKVKLMSNPMVLS